MSLRVIFGLILVVAAQGDAWAATPATATNLVSGRVIDAATKNRPFPVLKSLRMKCLPLMTNNSSWKYELCA